MPLTSTCPSLFLVWETFHVSEGCRLPGDPWTLFHLLLFSSHRTVKWLSLMPRRDGTGAKLAKLKRMVRGFQVCFLCFFVFLVFFSPHSSSSMIYGAVQNLGKFWRYDFVQILSKGFLPQIVFSDPWNWWGLCWVASMGAEKGWPYPAVRNFTAALALWCATPVVLHSGIFMGRLCFALALVHCLVLFWMWPPHETLECTGEGRNSLGSCSYRKGKGSKNFFFAVVK